VNACDNYYVPLISCFSSGTTLGKLTVFGLDGHGSNLASKPAVRPALPPVQWGPVAFSPGVKREGREASHLLSSRAEVKNVWRFISTS
jgi:hypothetical protein